MYAHDGGPLGGKGRALGSLTDGLVGSVGAAMCT